MATKQDVLRLFQSDPEQTSIQIAKKLGCHSAYVRATLTRNGLRLSRTRASPGFGKAFLLRSLRDIAKYVSTDDKPTRAQVLAMAEDAIQKATHPTGADQ